MKPHTYITLCLVALVALSCDEALYDDDYLGLPLFECRGSISGESERASAPLLLTLQWMRSNTSTDGAVRSRTTPFFPSRFGFSVFTAPSERSLVRLGDMSEAAIARFLVFEDLDLDGAWSPGVEAVRGASSVWGVVYAAEPLELPQLEGPLGVGYHLVKIAPCGRSSPPGRLVPMRRVDARDTFVELDLFAPDALTSRDMDCDGVDDFSAAGLP